MPTHGDCLFTLVWHVRDGHFGDVDLAGLNVVSLGDFTGNMWIADPDAKMRLMFYIDVRVAALTGPTSDPGRRVTTANAPGAEVGPGQVATWGVVQKDEAVGFGWWHEYRGGSSKHFPFDWRPGAAATTVASCGCHA